MAKKFALVVGASGEIGIATSLSMAEAGWSLYLHFASNKEKVDELIVALDLELKAFRLSE